MACDSEITRTEIQKLLKYYDYFQDENNSFYEKVNGYKLESDQVLQFFSVLNEIGFLVVFDWVTWINNNEIYKDVKQNIDDHIMSANLEELRKLMTAYVRGNRFNEGLLINVIEHGKVAVILRRLKELEQLM